MTGPARRNTIAGADTPHTALTIPKLPKAPPQPASLFEAGVHPLEDEWVALDVETTGLSPDDDEIIEVGAVRFRGAETLDTFHSLVNPNRKIGAFIRRYTGIAQEEVDAAPPFSKVASRLESFVGGLPIVGHNIDFDLGFLAAQGVRFTGPKADTLELAYVLKPSWEYSLEKVAAALGLSHDRPHRALDDAEVTSRIFNLLVEDAGRLDDYALAEMQRLASRSSWVLAYLLRRLETHKMLERRPPPGPRADTERRAQASVTGIDVSSLRERLKRSRALIPNKTSKPVEVGQVRALLSRGGPVSQAMAGYEERAEQAEMAEAVTRAINDGKRLIVEAGTGVGKSMAYLLPAALYALKNNVRVVVSTNTINLQEQLLNKDVPAVAEALRGVDDVPVDDFRYSLLKGRNNYLCLKRWSSLRSSDVVSSDEARMLSKLLVWMQTTGTGDRSELNLSGGGWTPWERVSAQGALDCAGVGGACFLRHARDRAAAAHVVIVNHALLVTDILTGGAAIPDHDVLIVDEAQHLEGVATDHLGFQISQAGLEDHLDLLAGERGLLNRAALALRGSSAAQTRRDSLDGAAQRIIAALPPVREGMARLFGVLQRLLPASGAQSRFGQELRITASTRSQPAWSEAEIAWQDADAALAELDSATTDLFTSLEGLEDAGVLDYEALLMETISLRERTREIRRRFNEAVPHPEENGIYWLSRSSRSSDLEVNMAPVHVGDLLEKLVFSQRRAVVLTSATLSTEDGFGHIIERTGFAEADELRLGSPFDYPKAALLCVPNDMPEPSAWDYQAAVEQAVMDAALAAGGATMALFTSHASLQSTSRALKGSLEAQGFEVLAQGVDGTPHQLVRRFVENPKSVLLGTSSFWEGVDLAGDALKVLLVARLPFSVPTDPVFSARSELYERAFDEYAVPQAILRLRQGFGRLIRTSRDRGVAVILDKRAVSRRYGRAFLDSLPPATRRTPALYELPGEIRRWLRAP